MKIPAALAGLVPGLSELKLIAAGAAAAAVLGAFGWTYLHGRRDAAAALKPKVAAAQAQAATAVAQGGLSTAAAAIPAAADRRGLDITVHAETAAHAVEQALGATAPLPPDVLRGWAAGVDGLRVEAADAADDGASHRGGADAARPLPPA